MSAELPPPPPPPPGGYPPPPPSDPYGRGAYGAPPPARPGRTYTWWLVLIGIVVGFPVGVVASILLVLLTGFGSTLGGSGSSTAWWSVVALGAMLLVALGLVVWPRSRRLGQGVILGLAIGLIVAGGLCLPIVVGSA